MKKVNEDLADLAMKAEMDHEVQMARSQLYKTAKYAIKLHEMLKGVSEAEGLDGWVQAKITKASDYLGAVYHHLDYEMKFESAVNETKEKEEVTDESGLQRHIGIKKYGKKGFEELQKAGREGANEKEKGAIKDKHLKKDKKDSYKEDIAQRLSIAAEKFQRKTSKKD